MRKCMLVLTALLTPVLMSSQAYAVSAEDIIKPEYLGFFRVVATIDDLADIMGEVWNVMVSNPMLLVFLGAGLFSVGIWIFRKVRSAAKG